MRAKTESTEASDSRPGCARACAGHDPGRCAPSPESVAAPGAAAVGRSPISALSLSLYTWGWTVGKVGAGATASEAPCPSIRCGVKGDASPPAPPPCGALAYAGMGAIHSHSTMLPHPSITCPCTHPLFSTRALDSHKTTARVLTSTKCGIFQLCQHCALHHLEAKPRGLTRGHTAHRTIQGRWIRLDGYSGLMDRSH